MTEHDPGPESEIRALREEVPSLRRDMLLLARRTPEMISQPWPYNIPQNLWGTEENDAIALIQRSSQQYQDGIIHQGYSNQMNYP